MNLDTVIENTARRRPEGFLAAVAFVSLALSGSSACAQAGAEVHREKPPTVHIDTSPAHLLNTFDPDSALGSSVDVLSRSGIDQVYSPHIIEESLSAGWGPITYRNNSELRMAAWHWTENGVWSDPGNKSGYFTGDTELKEPVRYILFICFAPSRLLDERRLPAAGTKSQLLEEQPVSHDQIH